ncbi:MAG: inorganic diphosphatase [Armatimonas sp.]
MREAEPPRGLTDPLGFLGRAVTVHIDRLLGSRHPRHGFIYSLNYGFLPDTLAPDGAEVDAYVLGVFDPIETFQGVCVAVIRRTNDNDDKLIVVPRGDEEERYTDAQIIALTEFQERFFSSYIIRFTEAPL